MIRVKIETPASCCFMSGLFKPSSSRQRVNSKSAARHKSRLFIQCRESLTWLTIIRANPVPFPATTMILLVAIAIATYNGIRHHAEQHLSSFNQEQFLLKNRFPMLQRTQCVCLWSLSAPAYEASDGGIIDHSSAALLLLNPWDIDHMAAMITMYSWEGGEESVQLNHRDELTALTAVS